MFPTIHFPLPLSMRNFIFFSFSRSGIITNSFLRFFVCDFFAAYRVCAVLLTVFVASSRVFQQPFLQFAVYRSFFACRVPELSFQKRNYSRVSRRYSVKFEYRVRQVFFNCRRCCGVFFQKLLFPRLLNHLSVQNLKTLQIFWNYRKVVCNIK